MHNRNHIKRKHKYKLKHKHRDAKDTTKEDKVSDGMEQARPSVSLSFSWLFNFKCLFQARKTKERDFYVQQFESRLSPLFVLQKL